MPKNVPWQPRIESAMGKIERRAFLANVGGRQIDGDALQRKIVAAIFQRGLDALAAFLHGNVRQADNIEIAGPARADVHFDFHEVGVDAKHRGAEVFEVHVSSDVTTSAGARVTQMSLLYQSKS